jgi:hypothetical protein
MGPTTGIRAGNPRDVSDADDPHGQGFRALDAFDPFRALSCGCFRGHRGAIALRGGAVVPGERIGVAEEARRGVRARRFLRSAFPWALQRNRRNVQKTSFEADHCANLAILRSGRSRFLTYCRLGCYGARPLRRPALQVCAVVPENGTKPSPDSNALQSRSHGLPEKGS